MSANRGDDGEHVQHEAEAVHLSGDQIGRLQQIVVQHFSLDDLQQLVHTHLDEQLSNYSGNGDTLPTAAFKLIVGLQQRDRTRELIVALVSTRPKSRALVKFAREIDPSLLIQRSGGSSPDGRDQPILTRILLLLRRYRLHGAILVAAILLLGAGIWSQWTDEVFEPLEFAVFVNNWQTARNGGEDAIGNFAESYTKRPTRFQNWECFIIGRDIDNRDYDVWSEPREEDNHLIAAHFSSADHFDKGLQKGNKIRIDGEIGYVGRGAVTLMDCKVTQNIQAESGIFRQRE